MILVNVQRALAMRTLVVLIAGFLVVLVILRTVAAPVMIGATIWVSGTTTWVIALEVRLGERAAKTSGVRQQYANRYEGADQPFKPNAHRQFSSVMLRFASTTGQERSACRIGGNHRQMGCRSSPQRPVQSPQLRISVEGNSDCFVAFAVGRVCSDLCRRADKIGSVPTDGGGGFAFSPAMLLSLSRREVIGFYNAHVYQESTSRTGCASLRADGTFQPSIQEVKDERI
jgi:hypothetical protein